MPVLALLSLAAEHVKPDKTPFYVCGGVLAGWALLLFAVSTLSHEFPRSQAAKRTVMALSVLLVAAVMASAVITS